MLGQCIVQTFVHYKNGRTQVFNSGKYPSTF